MKNPQNFEYVFHFLFSTFFWQNDKRWNEPSLEPQPGKKPMLAQGVNLGKDKRLFRRDVKRGEPLEKWGKHLNQYWQEICQVYVDAFKAEGKNPDEARRYCQQAFLGVGLLILEDSDSLAHHSVKISAQNKELYFTHNDHSETLFQIEVAGFESKATCYRLPAMETTGRLSCEHLQLCIQAEPHLVPLVDDELAPNPAFLVCGFTFGGAMPEWQGKVEAILLGKGLSGKSSLLATLFTRLLVQQWQFMRIDKAADNVREKLQGRNRYYSDYARAEDRPYCSRTRTLEKHLQEMHSLNVQARLTLSRIQGAVHTLEINRNNLTSRLDEISQEVKQINGSFQFVSGDKAQVVFLASPSEIPLVTEFNDSMKSLQDHSVYIHQQTEYLGALRDKWLSYLENRKTQMGEYLNTIVTVLVFSIAGSTGAAVTININKGLLGLPFENKLVYLSLVIGIFVLPILWYFTKWAGKWLNCFWKRITSW